MPVINELLGYERFKIAQDPEMFHFSLDSMLLAHFATINRKTNVIVDFCSGNFPIPIYLTMRTNAQIYGIEIQDKAIELASISIKLNQLEERISIIHDDVKNAHKHFSSQVDLVLCNPPFFKINKYSNLNHNKELSIARHEVLINLEEIIKEASLILKEGGYLAMVHRPDRLGEIMNLLAKYHFQPARLQIVYPKKDRSANHILLEARFGGSKNPNLHILQPLYVYKEDNKWTTEILKIYNYGREK